MALSAISPEWAKRMKALGGVDEDGNPTTDQPYSTDEEDAYLKGLASQTIQPYRAGWGALPGVGASIVGGLAARQLRQNAERKQSAEQSALQAYFAPSSPQGATTNGAQPVADDRAGKMGRLIQALPPGPTRDRYMAKYEAMNDPDTALDREVKLEQLKKLRERSDLSSVIEQRRQAAAAAGMDVNDPAVKRFLLTGEMANAPKMDVSEKKMIEEADDIASKSQSALSALNEALQLSPKAYAGPGARTQAGIVSIAPWSTENADATIKFDNIITGQALDQLRAIFGGAPTEGERQILLEIQGSASQKRPVREDTIRRAIDAVNRRVAINQSKAKAIREGRYFEPGYEAPEPPQPAQQPSPQSANGEVPTVNTPEEAAQLPPGTQFRTPDGQIRVRK